MRYFEKLTDFEKSSAFNLLGGALTLAKKVAPGFIDKIVAGEGSAFMKGVTKVMGSEGTKDSIMAASKAGKFTAGEAEKLTGFVSDNIPKSMFRGVQSVSPEVGSAMKAEATGAFRMRDYMGREGNLKGIGSYFKNEVLGGEGAGFGQLKRQLASNKTFVTEGGELANRSIAGRALRTGIEVGGAALYAKDAFGDLQPGETRAGKVMGAAAGLYGFSSARKGLAGLMRGTVMGSMGTRIGNTFGTKAQAPMNGNPLQQQYNTGTQTY